MLELLQIYKDGAVLATMDGSVNSVDYEQGTAYTTEIPLVTISPDESMSVTISVDEMDILSLELGQQVTVSVGSLDDATFVGTLTEIDKTATSSSGVTTYSAVITLDKDAQMLPGMTADVAVRIEGVDNAIIIPIEALHQTSTNAFVYTQYDEETKEYSGMVEVTVGISNSSYVEITSGLNEGDTVYYTESGTDSIFGGMDFGNMGGFGGDFGGGMPGGDFGGFSGDFGGEMPSGGDFGGFGGDFGGEMPSGGGFGGGMPSGGGMPNFGGMGQ